MRGITFLATGNIHESLFPNCLLRFLGVMLFRLQIVSEKKEATARPMTSFNLN